MGTDGCGRVRMGWHEVRRWGAEACRVGLKYDEWRGVAWRSVGREGATRPRRQRNEHAVHSAGATGAP